VKLYSAADLHSNNHFLTIIDEQDKRILEKRLPNELSVTLKTLEPYRADISGIAVESTFNWYWLVDGLMEARRTNHRPCFSWTAPGTESCLGLIRARGDCGVC